MVSSYYSYNALTAIDTMHFSLALNLQDTQDEMKIVDIIIAVSASKYGETATMTNAELTNRGWLVFHEQALARITALEQEVAAIRGEVTGLRGAIATFNHNIATIMNALEIGANPAPNPAPQGGAEA